MRNVNINYPHPVLSGFNEDYIDCMFSISFSNDIVIEGDQILFDVNYNLVSKGLQEMITNDDARVVIYLESVESEFRTMQTFGNNSTKLTVKLLKSQLSSIVEIRGYIISNQDNNGFSLPEHNKELFVAGPSRIRKGDILAISDEIFKIPLESFDPLADRRSIFSIRQNPDQKEEIKIDLTTYEKITIILNADIFSKYQKLYEASETRTLLTSIFAVPVLVDVLSIIKKANQDSLEDIQEKKWYQVLQVRLSELKIDLNKEDSMTEVANKVLSHVFRDTMTSFEAVFEELMRGAE